MTTFLVDCGPGGELVELGRRVVSYLGPDAALGRSTDLAYGGVDARARGADVFIGLQSTGAMGTETWVHPRGGQRSRALADTIQSEMTRYGGRGATRIGDLSVLAPERLPAGAAACVVEVDDRVRYARDGMAIDSMASAIARAAQGARYGRRARGLEGEAAADPAKYFENLLADPAARQRLSTQDGATSAIDGLGAMPAEVRTELIAYLRDNANAPTSSGQSWSRGLEDPEVTVSVEAWGIVFALNNQATNDLVNTGALTGAMISAAGALAPAQAKIVLGILGAVIAAMCAVIKLMNRGNGVYLTIPWLALLPWFPAKVIPTPR